MTIQNIIPLVEVYLDQILTVRETSPAMDYTNVFDQLMDMTIHMHFCLP